MARQRIINGDDESRNKSASSDDPPRKPPAPPGIEFRPDDEKHDDELRPQKLDDVVGQRKAVERLRIMLDAAKKRNEPLGHLLFDGPPGLGKTTFATVIPKELGVDFQIASAPALTAPKDVLPYLTNAGFGSVLFLDEIHRLPPAVEEFLYPVMEDFRVDIALGEGMNARTINMPLKKFTVIGATTRSGLLTAPLRDRFVNRLHLDFYDDADLAEIVNRNARKLRSEIEPAASAEISKRSRGTPRKANNLLYWCRDYADSRAKGCITADAAKLALEMIEVDHVGLDELDRKYLLTLINVFAGGPAGLSAIAHSMNCPSDTLEDEIEPFLLRVGFLQRTPRGRVVTSTALNHLGLEPPNQGTLF